MIPSKQAAFYMPNSFERKAIAGLLKPQAKHLRWPTKSPFNCRHTAVGWIAGVFVQCLRRDGIRPLLQPGAVRHILTKRRQHRAAVFSNRSRQQHSIRLESAQLARRKVRDDDYFATHNLLGRVVLSDAG